MDVDTSKSAFVMTQTNSPRNHVFNLIRAKCLSQEKEPIVLATSGFISYAPTWSKDPAYKLTDHTGDA